MMQRWADYLDDLKVGETSKVIVGNFARAGA
jgi:hypothetical protein